VHFYLCMCCVVIYCERQLQRWRHPPATHSKTYRRRSGDTVVPLHQPFAVAVGQPIQRRRKRRRRSSHSTASRDRCYCDQPAIWCYHFERWSAHGAAVASLWWLHRGWTGHIWLHRRSRRGSVPEHQLWPLHAAIPRCGFAGSFRSSSAAD